MSEIDLYLQCFTAKALKKMDHYGSLVSSRAHPCSAAISHDITRAFSALNHIYRLLTDEVN